ncbi:MAG: DNA polymerase III subunit delta [Spirochaetales bacterium]|jgi:DNA polymerase-3 subunit delta|nr:DNA polymerase III subunit delta [Spirochaetales bacterium]
MIELGQAYLLLGPERGNKQDFLLKLKAQVKKEHPELEESRYYPFETSMKEAINFLSTGALFSEAKWVEIPQAETIHKDDAALLGGFLRRLPQDCLVFLLSDGFGRDLSAALTKAIPPGRTKKFYELRETEKKDWIKKFFQQAGMELEEGADAAILALVENETGELKRECEQLVRALSVPEKPDAPAEGAKRRITPGDVEEFLYHSREENIFTLFDRVLRRDLAGTLEVCRKLMLAQDQDPDKILGGLVWQFRRLLDLIAAMAQGSSFDEACQKAGVWQGRMKDSYRIGAGNYGLAEMEALMSLLAKTFRNLRQSRTEIHSVLLDRFFIRVLEPVKKAPSPSAED